MRLKVAGYCPMGCGKTLLSTEVGYIICSYLQCPRPTAVSELLDDRESEHVVRFGADSFTVRHPLRERLDDALFDCELHAYCAALPGPPPQLGTYRVTRADDRWRFTGPERAS